MPYKTITKCVDPELYLEHNGVSVYRTYEEDNIDEPFDYWFTLDGNGENDREDREDFDVRELPDYEKDNHPPFLTGEDNTSENEAKWKEWHETGQEEILIRKAICLAIDKGILK